MKWYVRVWLVLVSPIIIVSFIGGFIVGYAKLFLNEVKRNLK